MQKPQKKYQQTMLTNFVQQKHTTKKDEVNSDLSKSQEHQSKSQQSKNSSQQLPPMYNVEFYLNRIPSQPNGEYIDKIHKLWYDNFNLLQRHHGFIQWLFPNSFTSRFNSQAYALSKEEEKLFRSDMSIAKRYVCSYQMMLRFYGMKLKSKMTGEIVRAREVNFKDRYIATLLTSFHNHMRITRILCSLTMVGFGRYAKQLSLFLAQEIHSEKGELKPLAKYNVDKDWKEYTGYVETYDDLNVYLKYFENEKKQQKDVAEKLQKLTEQKEEEVKSKQKQEEIQPQKKIQTIKNEKKKESK